MRMLIVPLLVPVLVAGAIVAPDSTSASSSSGAPVAITEWTVPWENSRPRDPYVDGEGRVWFVGQAGNYIAHLDPRSGQFRRFEIEEGTHPHNLIVENGVVWYAGNRNARIGRLDPATGKVTIYPMPDTSVRDPHTLISDGKGHIWFTAQFGNVVGRLSTATGTVDIVRIPTPDARPYGIVVDARGRPWFDLFGTNAIGTIDPATMRLRTYPLPSDSARPRRIALTSDGAVWFVDYRRGMLGRLDPASGAVTEWPNPAGARSLPYAMASDDRDRLWFVETGVQPNRLVGFDPKSERFFSITPIAESGARTVRHMVFHEPTRTLWFGTDANTIGRAVVP